MFSIDTDTSNRQDGGDVAMGTLPQSTGLPKQPTSYASGAWKVDECIHIVTIVEETCIHSSCKMERLIECIYNI